MKQRKKLTTQPLRHQGTKESYGFSRSWIPLIERDSGERNNPLSEREEKIGKAIVEAAYIVHKNMGPGLLEKVYEDFIKNIWF